MAVTTLDTHAVVKELMAAGFTDAQAEAVTRQLQRAQDIDLSNLATKVDLAALAAKTDLADLATRMDLASTATKKDVLEAKNEVLKWIIGSVALQVIAIIGAVVALMRAPPH